MIKNVCVIGGGVLGSQIAYQTAYCGFDVTVLTKTEDSVKDIKDKLNKLKVTYIYCKWRVKVTFTSCQRLINKQSDNISDTMNRVVKLSESELKAILHESVKRALIKEQVDYEREIQLAHKTMMKMCPLLTDLGLRLNGTRFRLLYQDVRDSMVALNNAMINHLRGEGKQ